MSPEPQRAAARPLKDRISRRLFSDPRVGRPMAYAARAAGMNDLSRYISRWCRWAPHVVDFGLRCGDEVLSGRMYSASSQDHIVRRIWISGAAGYEAPMPSMFAAVTRQKVWALPAGAATKQGHVFVIGANSGFYAILAGLGKGARRVHAFEPYPPAYDWLEKNVKLNPAEGTVKLVAAAISDKIGETTLLVPPPRFGAVLETSASINPDYHEQVGQKIPVPMLTVDEYAKRDPECGLGGVSVMLIDIEGFEHAALEGARGVLQTSRPIVFFEVLNRASTQVAALERIRKDHGYRCLGLEPAELTFSEPVQPSEQYSNQLMVPEERMDALREAAALAGVRFNPKG